MKFDREGYTLSSGRTFYANRAILGLSPIRNEYNGRLEISEGYDGGVSMDHRYDDDDTGFTAEERKEIAEFMAVLWLEWGSQEPPSQP